MLMVLTALLLFGAAMGTLPTWLALKAVRLAGATVWKAFTVAAVFALIWTMVAALEKLASPFEAPALGAFAAAGATFVAIGIMTGAGWRRAAIAWAISTAFWGLLAAVVFLDILPGIDR